MEDLEWIRALLEDAPETETEAATGTAGQRDFHLANPPAKAGTITVTVDGAQFATPGDFALLPSTSKPSAVRFATAPPEGAHLVFQYERQVFSDAELDSHLAIATRDWPDPERHQLPRVYRAAQLAVDSLLMGAATALRFGAGGDAEFDLPSVMDRLERLRSVLVGTLAAEAMRPGVIEPTEEPTP